MKRTTYVLTLGAAATAAVFLSACGGSSVSSGAIANCDHTQDIVLGATDSCVYNPTNFDHSNTLAADLPTLTCNAQGLITYNIAAAGTPVLTVSYPGTGKDARCSNHKLHPFQETPACDFSANITLSAGGTPSCVWEFSGAAHVGLYSCNASGNIQIDDSNVAGGAVEIGNGSPSNIQQRTFAQGGGNITLTCQ